MEKVEVFCLDSGCALGEFKLLRAHLEKARGLLGTKHDAEPVLLAPCSGIHTWGMGYAIDVAFVDREGTVLLSTRALRPFGSIGIKGAFAVLERPASDEPWPGSGERLLMEGSQGYALTNWRSECQL